MPKEWIEILQNGNPVNSEEKIDRNLKFKISENLELEINGVRINIQRLRSNIFYEILNYPKEFPKIKAKLERDCGQELRQKKNKCFSSEKKFKMTRQPAAFFSFFFLLFWSIYYFFLIFSPPGTFCFLSLEKKGLTRSF